jgi:hypothetical protein
MQIIQINTLTPDRTSTPPVDAYFSTVELWSHLNHAESIV